MNQYFYIVRSAPAEYNTAQAETEQRLKLLTLSRKDQPPPLSFMDTHSALFRPIQLATPWEYGLTGNDMKISKEQSKSFRMIDFMRERGT